MDENRPKRRGHDVIDLDLDSLGRVDASVPPGGLSVDEQVRCLAYVARRIREIARLPEGVGCEVIAMTGHPDPSGVDSGRYPALGLYDIGPPAGVDSLSVEEALAAFVRRTGAASLLRLSADEPLTWAEVLGDEGLAP